MPYTNSWEEKGLYRLFTDKLTGEEVLTSVLEAYGNPRFDSLRYIINDFSLIFHFEINEFELKRIAVTDNVVVNSNSCIKVAIVATYEPLLEWIKRYLDQMQDSLYEYKLFSTVDEAREWVKTPIQRYQLA